MNLSELRQAVASLVFENEIDNESQFFQSVNRAIYRVRMTFPKIRQYRIAQYPIKNMLGENHNQIYESGQKIVFKMKDILSYSFQAVGKGKMIVKWFNPSNAVLDFEQIYMQEFDSATAFTAYSGLIKRFDNFMHGDFEIEFSSDYYFQVKNVAFYDMLKSSSKLDIEEFDEKISYNLKTLTSEYGKTRGVSQIRETFLGLSKAPKLNLGATYHPIEFKMVDGILEVPRKYRGEIIVEYIAEPETVGDGSNEKDEIDTPKVITDALAYLVASNLILDDDAEKSSHYLSLYREAEANAQNKVDVGNQIYENTSKWC